MTRSAAPVAALRTAATAHVDGATVAVDDPAAALAADDNHAQHAITVIRFTPASALDRSTGLIGYVVLDIAGLLRIRDATIRRSRAGRIYVAMPDRVDNRGRRRSLITPIDGAARAAIDAAVLEALARDGRLPVLGDVGADPNAVPVIQLERTRREDPRQ